MTAAQTIIIPIRTGNGLNDRGHWRGKARRVAAEREAVAWVLLSYHPRPALPVTVLLTRVAPSSGVDDDNLAGALKAVRDQVARWMWVDDRRRDIVRYVYDQRRGPWAVEIEFKPGIENV